ncbi:MAG TPA: universal stress protein, partial [Longimicrobiales bacterium]|nr:universal stress protein [Longimicrobiales bacterium]
DRFDGSLTVLFVEKPFVYAYAGTLGEPSQLSAVDDDDAAHSEGWRSEREEWLREQVRAADVDPATATLRVAEGRPPDRILEAREQTGADLVVVGSHGRGALGRIFLGSVSGAVLRRCPGPVLLVPEATARASG